MVPCGILIHFSRISLALISIALRCVWPSFDSNTNYDNKTNSANINKNPFDCHHIPGADITNKTLIKLSSVTDALKGTSLPISAECQMPFFTMEMVCIALHTCWFIYLCAIWYAWLRSIKCIFWKISLSFCSWKTNKEDRHYGIRLYLNYLNNDCAHIYHLNI